MTNTRELLKTQAAIFRIELDHFEMSAWEKDLAKDSEGDIREAFNRHRRDHRPLGADGRVRGEFWPTIAVILSHLDAIRIERMNVNPSGRMACPNPECMDGWVKAYTKPAGAYGAQNRYVKRCSMCHQGQVAA